MCRYIQIHIYIHMHIYSYFIKITLLNNICFYISKYFKVININYMVKI